VIPVLLFAHQLSGTAFAAASKEQKSRLAQELCGSRFEGRASGDSSEKDCRALAELAERAASVVDPESTRESTIERLNQFFFEQEGFQPTYDLTSPEHLLVNGVLAGRKGHCVGLASVYLILAEELHLPIYGVATPKHIFLRWDDGKFRRNIELFQKGRQVGEEDYIREQKIPKESIEQGVFLANLSRKQFLGFVYQNLGVLESQAGRFEQSQKHYAHALRLNPRLAAAYYNRGNDELKQKSYKKAIHDYTKSLKLYPTDAWALWNRGLAWKGLGEMEKAETDSSRAKEIDPTFKSAE